MKTQSELEKKGIMHEAILNAIALIIKHHKLVLLEELEQEVGGALELELHSDRGEYGLKELNQERQRIRSVINKKKESL